MSAELRFRQATTTQRGWIERRQAIHWSSDKWVTKSARPGTASPCHRPAVQVPIGPWLEPNERSSLLACRPLRSAVRRSICSPRPVPFSLEIARKYPILIRALVCKLLHRLLLASVGLRSETAKPTYISKPFEIAPLVCHD
jgi:hypothetical protein